MTEFLQQSEGIKPEQIIDIIIRRRWIIILPLCATLTIGFFYTLTAPKTYKATTTILIQPQKVPTDYVQSIITTDIGQRINTISQRILSRTNIEKIIEEFGLFQDKPNMYQEDRVYSVKERVKVVQQSSMRQGTEAFSVSFTGNDPVKVMNIANTMAGFFMDENLKARELQAVGTSEFLESELDKIKKKLEDHEEKLAAYRAKNMGGLPDELETNLRTLDRLQLQHTDALTVLRDTQNAASLLKNQISRLKELSHTGVPALQMDGSFPEGSGLSPTQQQYEIEKSQLDELLLKYTTKHPEVAKLTRSIEKLEEKLKKENIISNEAPDSSGTLSMVSSNDNAIFQHELNLRQLENEIANTKANIEKIKQAMQIYQKRVEDTPKREQELQSIQRDYDNIRESYRSLLARRLEAELAVNMEKKQKGEQFRIIDHARLPEKPISPDVRMSSLFSLVVGLVIGGCIIFMLEFVNPAIRSEDQIETEIGLPILASIPPMEKPGHRTKKMIEHSAFFVTSFYAGSLLLLFSFMHLKGIDKTMELIKTYIQP